MNALIENNLMSVKSFILMKVKKIGLNNGKLQILKSNYLQIERKFQTPFIFVGHFKSDHQRNNYLSLINYAID